MIEKDKTGLDKPDSACPDNLAAECPFRGCGKRNGGLKRTLDILGGCMPAECPKEEVEQVLDALGSIHKKAGAQGTFRLAFTIPEATARMALALAVTKLSGKDRGYPA